MDYKTKPISRLDLRKIAYWFRSLFKTRNKYRFDAIGAFEKIHSIFPQVTVEVVEDVDLPENVPARCTPDFKGNYHIEVKDSVYVGACDGIGGYRNHIVHELSHSVLCLLGFTPILERSFKDNEISNRSESMEWQAKALCGEIMIPYEETKGLSKKKIMFYCQVSEASAEMRLKLDKNISE